MHDDRLDKRRLAELRAAHRAARNAREAYRLNAVILLGSGGSPSEVAVALVVDDDTVRNHFKCDLQDGIAELSELDAHLQQELHSSAVSVARWVKERFGVHDTDNGMTALLHRLGYLYKKPKLLCRARHPHQRRRRSSSLPTKSSMKTEARTMTSCSWMPPTRSTIRSSVVAGSSAGTASPSKALRAGGA